MIKKTREESNHPDPNLYRDLMDAALAGAGFGSFGVEPLLDLIEARGRDLYHEPQTQRGT